MSAFLTLAAEDHSSWDHIQPGSVCCGRFPLETGILRAGAEFAFQAEEPSQLALFGIAVWPEETQNLARLEPDHEFQAGIASSGEQLSPVPLRQL